ncbi:MAG TPA: glutamate formimidoyltransferase [Acidobacteriaceae bacterium]|nr:glutamate formimidoyltransferase [Acidobacteriaceae bacterium]
MGNNVEQIVECVPNFSEGRDRAKVGAILAAMHVAGVSLLDWSLDADHNRSVITIAGPPAAVREAAVNGAVAASRLIDLTAQEGVHPRMGAADVIPFVPIANISLEQCALLARQAGMELWSRARVPSYFYEAAAARPDRAKLEDVRRGQFEGLREDVKRDSSRQPDVGGPELHPTAGASAIGARRLLIAYNIFLDTAVVATARAIAREIRASAGGLAGVKAMGVLAHGCAQISMNITDFRTTSVGAAFRSVKQQAAKYKAKPVRGELVGLLPELALEPGSEWMEQLEGFKAEERVLERRLENPLPWPQLTEMVGAASNA